MTSSQPHTLTIEAMNAQGQGLAHVDNRPWVINDTLTGETVRAEPFHVGQQRTQARVVERLTPSPFLNEKPCPYLVGEDPVCGGCPLGRLNREAQAREKTALITEALAEHHVPFPPEGFERVLMSDTLTQFRNKAILYAGFDPQQTAWGFGLYQAGSHQVVLGTAHCEQTPAWMGEAADTMVKILNPLIEAHGLSVGADIRALLARDTSALPQTTTTTTAPTRLLGLVLGAVHGDALKPIRESLQGLGALPAFEGVNLSLIHGVTGNNVLNGTHEAIHPNGVPALAHIDGLAFEVNLGTFLHVNTPQTWPLYDLTLAWAEITPDDTFLDLYCGVGTLTLLGARKAKAALGIEVVESSIEAARENARRNELNHVTFEAGKVEVVLPKALREGFTPSVAIVDPAFKGMESSVITALSRVSPLKRLVYVSCNPKTFARDAALFIKAGWRLERLGAVDLFPGALHMEAIGRFTRD